MEFESSERKKAPQSLVCVAYDREGRIVHGHIFVGEGRACSARRGVKSANARRSKARVAIMATSCRDCESCTRRPRSALLRMSRIVWTSRPGGSSSTSDGRLEHCATSRRRRRRKQSGRGKRKLGCGDGR